MRDYRNAKLMASTLRQALRERRLEFSHSGCILEGPKNLDFSHVDPVMA